jgi:predicted dehydrogenase
LITLKFAIVGCGRIARRHAQHIQSVGVLIAVCDSDFDKALELAAIYQAKAFHSIEDLLKNETDLDVVSVCTPNGYHAHHAIQAMESGFHVLVEKPMALSVDECNQMINAAKNCKRELFVVKQNRFNPPVAAVKAALQNNILGKVYSVQVSCFWNRNTDYYTDAWRGTLELDGGTLFTQVSHFIDLLYWLLGDIESCQAIIRNFAHQGIIAFEDTGVVLLEFKSGVIGTLHYTVNSYKRNMEGSITIIAEKGTVKIGGQYLNELEYQCVENFTFDHLEKGNGPNNYDTYTGSMSNHDKIYQNLADVLLDGASACTQASEALKTVDIIQKIYQSARLVKLPDK